jgi:biopolymer transport protein ExbB
MKTLFKIAAAVSLSASLLAGTAMAQESQRQPVTSISQLLDRVRADARDAAAENQRRLQEFRANRDRQAALVAQARGQLNALEATGAANQAQFEANQAQIQELDAQLRREQGAFGELFGAARQKSGDRGVDRLGSGPGPSPAAARAFAEPHPAGPR